jgi:hypothetical protein
MYGSVGNGSLAMSGDNTGINGGLNPADYISEDFLQVLEVNLSP